MLMRQNSTIRIVCQNMNETLETCTDSDNYSLANNFHREDDNSLKICVICRRLMIHGIGGLEIYVQTLYELLAKQGHEVHIICTPIKNTLKHLPNGVWIHQTWQPAVFDRTPFLRILDLLTFEIFALIEFLRLKKRHSFGLVHVHARTGLFSFAIAKKLGLYSEKLISTQHGDAVDAYKSLCKIKLSHTRRLLTTLYHRFYVIPLTLFSLQQADIVVVTSTLVRNNAINFFKVPRKKMFFIVDAASNPVDLPSFSRRPIFLFVGRLVQRKNINIIIEAFKLLNKSYPQAKLYIVGNGPERENLEILASKLNLNNKVVFTGSIPEAELERLYSESLGVLMPSFHEGVSNILPEAMSHGTPVIATYESGAKDVMSNEKDGFIVDGKNPQEFADRMSQMLSNPKMVKKMIRNAYVKSHNFSWMKNATDHIKLYMKLVK